MRTRSLFLGGIVLIACASSLTILGSARVAAAEPAAPDARQDGRPVRTINVAVFPDDARIAVDGQPREHRGGALALTGPLGAVFTIEAVANGVRVVERVAVTDIGALPAVIAVPAHGAGHCVSAAPVAATASVEPGFLRLAVYPWATVIEGDRVVCTTPCNRVALPPGPHTLSLENAEHGIRSTIVVNIRSGETTAKAIAFK